jgi:y4mF family transcriptional regulator
MEDEVRTESVFVDCARDVGVQVRSRRIALSLSQQQLAERAGVGRRFIVDLEAGKGTVQFDTVAKVCSALDMEFLVRQPVLNELDLIRQFRRSRTPRPRTTHAERAAVEAVHAIMPRKDLSAV